MDQRVSGMSIKLGVTSTDQMMDYTHFRVILGDIRRCLDTLGQYIAALHIKMLNKHPRMDVEKVFRTDKHISNV